MFGHIMDKWDCYLTVLLGGAVMAVATLNLDPKLLAFFKYYVFAMIGVVIFDTFKNFSEHESPIWKFGAIASNAVVLLICLVILSKVFSVTALHFITALPFQPYQAFLALPNALLYTGIFLIVENLMWIYVYDHV